MKVFSIGFTRKSAREFFSLVAASGAKRLVDARLYNSSQLAGFGNLGNVRVAAVPATIAA